MAKKFIQSAIKRPGALRKKLGAKKGEPIAKGKVKKTISSLRKQAAGKKKLPAAKLRTLRQANLAKTLGKFVHRKKTS